MIFWIALFGCALAQSSRFHLGRLRALCWTQSVNHPPQSTLRASRSMNTEFKSKVCFLTPAFPQRNSVNGTHCPICNRPIKQWYTGNDAMDSQKQHGFNLTCALWRQLLRWTLTGHWALKGGCPRDISYNIRLARMLSNTPIVGGWGSKFNSWRSYASSCPDESAHRPTWWISSSSTESIETYIISFTPIPRLQESWGIPVDWFGHLSAVSQCSSEV